VKLLKIGIPKGSLENATIELFRRSGWRISVSSRSYFPSVDDDEIRCTLVRAQEMSRFVEMGTLDVGLTGKDWVLENGSDVVVVQELIYSKTSASPARWVLVVAEDSPIRKLKDLQGKKVKLSAKKVNELLGSEFTEKEVAKLLAKMDYGYEKGVVAVPPYRADVLGPVDIIEDVAIAKGYNNFNFTIPDFFSAGNKVSPYENIDNVMRGMGFLEMKTFILTNKEKLEAVGYTGKLIQISNPNNVEFTVVRPTLLADALDILSNNKMKGLPQKYYEIGFVEEGKERLVFAVMDKDLRFSDVRGYLQVLGRETGFELSLQKKQNKLFEEETSCVVTSGKKEIGIFGKVRKEVLERLEIFSKNGGFVFNKVHSIASYKT